MISSTICYDTSCEMFQFGTHNEVGSWQDKSGLVPPAASSKASRGVTQYSIYMVLVESTFRVIQRNEPSRQPVCQFLVEGTAGLSCHEGGVDNYCQGASITAGRPLCLESGSHPLIWILRFAGLLLQIRGIGVLGHYMNIIKQRWFRSEIGGLVAQISPTPTPRLFEKTENIRANAGLQRPGSFLCPT
jgi:hypothetical protein